MTLLCRLTLWVRLHSANKHNRITNSKNHRTFSTVRKGPVFCFAEYADNGFKPFKVLISAWLFWHKTKPHRSDAVLMAGVEGFEPSKWRSQSPMPYHLATPQYSLSYHCRDNVDYYITLKSRCQAFFEIFFDFFRLFPFLKLPVVIF